MRKITYSFQQKKKSCKVQSQGAGKQTMMYSRASDHYALFLFAILPALSAETMLSIIISSGNQQLLAAVRLNIAETAGILHEIIAIDNTSAKRGICEVYNEGIHRAKYPMLCFMHEDTILQTKN